MGISHRTGCNITIYNMGTFPVDVEPNQKVLNNDSRKAKKTSVAILISNGFLCRKLMMKSLLTMGLKCIKISTNGLPQVDDS